MLPISQFTYDAAMQVFRYLPTGEAWNPKGVDNAVGPIRHEGKLIRATVWLKYYAASGR